MLVVAICCGGRESGSGPKQTCRGVRCMSVLWGRADIPQPSRDVRVWPTTDLGSGRRLFL